MLRSVYKESFLKILFRPQVPQGHTRCRLPPLGDDRVKKGCVGEHEFPGLVRHADGLLALFSGHLSPDAFGILTEGGVLGVAAQGQREEAVSGGKVA